jgi:hypothetical protein
VNEAHIRSDLQRVNNEAGRQKNKAGCYLYLFSRPYFSLGSWRAQIDSANSAFNSSQNFRPAGRPKVMNAPLAARQ